MKKILLILILITSLYSSSIKECREILINLSANAKKSYSNSQDSYIHKEYANIAVNKMEFMLDNCELFFNQFTPDRQKYFLLSFFSFTEDAYKKNLITKNKLGKIANKLLIKLKKIKGDK